MAISFPSSMSNRTSERNDQFPALPRRKMSSVGIEKPFSVDLVPSRLTVRERGVVDAAVGSDRELLRFGANRADRRGGGEARGK